MDFSSFKKVDVANKRKEGSVVVREQEFDGIKFRKGASKKQPGSTFSKFTVSRKLFKELNLETYALDQFQGPDKNVVLIGVVADEDGKLLRKRKDKGKGDAFKSDSLEASLAAIGAIDSGLVDKSQFLNATVVATNVEIDGVKVLTVLQLTKGTSKPKAEKAKTEEAPKTTTTSEAPVEKTPEASAPVTDAPAPTAASATQAAATDWD